MHQDKIIKGHAFEHNSQSTKV